ncbi:DHA2 family efflux MFS transporter permease subunit [Phenylobacterium sp.]|uniref:DHA2 family efflux MFS transporter permease subunit n=1 Tax=Phenylobacterium sp. TaxID=1871053 RepID=UPI0035AF66C1
MSSATLSGPASPPRYLSGGALWGAAVLLAASNFLAILDMTIANVSVPNISGGLGASSSQGTWVITSYAVAEAITVPLTGWLAGRFGTVRTFVAAIIGFAVFSALCGLAPSLGVLVLFRVLQGICGGPLMPLSQTLMMTIFPPDKRPAAMGLWGVTTLVAPVAGPFMGGALCDNFGWPSIFYVNVPIAILCAPLVWRVLKDYETPLRKAKVDTVGLGLLVLWVGALQLMLDLGKERDWFENSTIVALGLVALVGFAAFMIWELTDSEPIVDLKVFKHSGFATATVVLSLVYGSFFATNVLTPLWLQTNMGYTATWAGCVTGLFGVLAIVSAPISSQLASRGDPRRLIFLGVGWLAVITFMRGFATNEMTYWQISRWLLLAGAGMPMFFMPINLVALGSVAPQETAAAAGLFNFIRTVSGAFATSLVTTLWENGSTRSHADLAGMMRGTQDTLDTLTGAGFSSHQAVADVSQMVQSQAVTISTNNIFLGCAAIFGIAAIGIWLTPRPRMDVDTSAAH